MSQLNRGAALITATTDGGEAAELNLLAGGRAKRRRPCMALAHSRRLGERGGGRRKRYALSFALASQPCGMRIHDRRARDRESAPCELAAVPPPSRSGRRHSLQRSKRPHVEWLAYRAASACGRRNNIEGRAGYERMLRTRERPVEALGPAP